MPKPEFQRRVGLEQAASTLSPGADAVRSARWSIDHREPVFRHKASFVSTLERKKYEYELRFDTPGAAHGEEGGWIEWDGDVAVVTFRHPLPDGSAGLMTVSFRYELTDGGRRIRASEQVRGTSWDQDNVWIFERR
jgi:hypothetical protein